MLTVTEADWAGWVATALLLVKQEVTVVTSVLKKVSTDGAGWLTTIDVVGTA